jgi:dTMP kinase
MTHPTELFLYLAARGQLMEEVIDPALKRGELVLCDRFTDSTLAYQGGGRRFSLPLLRALNDLATGGRTPDLTLLLDVSLATSNRRKDRVADRLEREKDRFFSRVARTYRSIAKDEPRRMVLINGNKDADQVWAQIHDVLEARLPR